MLEWQDHGKARMRNTGYQGRVSLLDGTAVGEMEALMANWQDQLEFASSVIWSLA